MRCLQMENSGLTVMLVNDEIEALERMYNLFERVDDGLEQMMERTFKYERALK